MTLSMSKEYWEKVYSLGNQLNLYPWSNIVSFLYNYKQRIPIHKGKVLEVGCGSGVNLHPFCRLGYDCIGIDYSHSAINFAQSISNNSGLNIVFKQFDIYNMDFF